MDRPSDNVDRELYYSGKKQRQTRNNVLLVDSFGSIHFLSDTYEGRVHDKCIADDVLRMKRDTPFQTRAFSIKTPDFKDLPAWRPDYAAKEEAAQWNPHAAGKGGKPAYLIRSRSY